jgi:hypothetical protein
MIVSTYAISTNSFYKLYMVSCALDKMWYFCCSKRFLLWLWAYHGFIKKAFLLAPTIMCLVELYKQSRNTTSSSRRWLMTVWHNFAQIEKQNTRIRDIWDLSSMWWAWECVPCSDPLTPTDPFSSDEKKQNRLCSMRYPVGKIQEHQHGSVELTRSCCLRKSHSGQCCSCTAGFPSLVRCHHPKTSPFASLSVNT